MCVGGECGVKMSVVVVGVLGTAEDVCIVVPVGAALFKGAGVGMCVICSLL